MIDYRILGPLEVSVDGQEIDISGTKLRALLVILLLRADESVPRDLLAHELWGEQQPVGSQHTLEVYISRLRKALGTPASGPVLVTRPGAYSLRLADGQLDARLFEHLAKEGRSALAGNAPDQATAKLHAALQLWRGRALADLGDSTELRIEAARLEELRLGATEDRIEADLALARHEDSVDELQALVATHPLRERLHGQLMIALYRSGRQAEALAAYQAARQTLVEELGLEPGPALQRLQRAILKQDASLELAGQAAAGPLDQAERTPQPWLIGPAPGRRRILQEDLSLPAPRPLGNPTRPHTHRTRLTAIAVAVAVVVAAGLFFGVGSTHRRQPALSGANGLVAVSTASGRLTAASRLDGAPEAVSSGASSVWVTDPDGGAVARIDPNSGATVDRILVGGDPGSIVSGGGAIWTASTVGATVARIDPATESVTQTISLPGSSLGAIAVGGGFVWVVDPVAHDLIEIDPATGSLHKTLPLDLQPSAIAVADGAIWVTGYNDATVEKLDLVSGRVVAHAHVGDGPAALAFEAGSLWVANSLDATVSRVDPGTMAVRATIPVGSGPSALEAAAGLVWVANQYSGSVSRIDPGRDQVATSVDVGGDPTSLALRRGRLWVGVSADGASHRGGTFVIATPVTLTSSNPAALSSVDPAFYNTAFNPQFTGLAYDALVTFQQSPGAAGLRLVPDLALAVPAPADGGKSYTFRLRPGIRYSDGQPLRASDFRRGIERLFRVRSPGTSYFSGIAGAAACAQHPADCTLSQGIVTDDASGTVVFHLTDPDPQFLFNLTQYGFAAPVPPGTPDHEPGSRFVPATGPYRIIAASSRQVRFARNPFFREWSHAAQPDGNPDAIVWRSVPTVQDAVAAVQTGRADWLFGLIPRPQYQQLRLQSPAQLHSSPVFGVDFAPLNTHRAPFNNVHVRQALNYAINRDKIVRLYGGLSFATATCQVITPGLPGYRRYCPYTLHPRPDGSYTGPNLARARRLVGESGTAGQHVDVWGASDSPYVPRGVPVYVASVLRTLGYRVRLHLLPDATFTEAMRQGFQLSVDGDWLASYPSPASYLPQFFGCGGGTSNGYHCDPRLDREMKEAGQLESSDLASARGRWESIDRQLTNEAIWVPTINVREVELLSKRVRNYEHHVVWGFLVDQGWLR
jgi:YVTN family beta-propeller protein